MLFVYKFFFGMLEQVLILIVVVRPAHFDAQAQALSGLT